MDRIGRIAESLERQEEFAVEALTKLLPNEWVLDALAASGRSTRRFRLLPSALVVWFVILLGTYRRVSYANLLERLMGGWWALRVWPSEKTPTTSAATKARDRVGLGPLQLLHRRSAREWVAAVPPVLVYGRRVSVLDGATMKVADADENRAHFGLPPSSRGRAGYPQMRTVLLLDLAARIVTAERHGPYRTAEINLAREILDDVEPGSLLLVDRNFYTFDFLWDLRQRRASDFLVRAKKTLDPRVVERLAPGDEIVEVRVPRHYRRDRPDMPRTWRLRRITYRIPGKKKRMITLLTSILDPAISAEELARLYRCRWEEETATDEIKTHLCACATVNVPVVFRSRTPERVVQELYGLLIAYNAVRKLMCEAASMTGVPAERVSFTAALERTREAVQDMSRMPAQQLSARYAQMLRAIARVIVPERPGRTFPRAVKIKMSKFPLKAYGRRRQAPGRNAA
jgi:hypothetical protein